MLIFLILIMCLSIPLINIYNIVAKNKIRNSLFVILLIATLQIFSVTLIGYIEVSFKFYYWAINIIFCAFLLGFIALIIYGITNKNNNYNWTNFKSDLIEKIKSNYILYISIIIFIVVCLFQTNRFDDTFYYFEISTNFHYNIFPDNYTYILPGSYFFYGSLSNGFITQWYYLFTPISFSIILFGIVNDFMAKIFIGKYKYLQKTAILGFVTLFTIFSAPTLISGNLYISACLIGIYMLYIHQKDFKCAALILLVSQFFSATGVMLSFALVFSTFLYLLSYGKVSEIIKLSPWYLLSLLGMPLLILSFANIGYSSLSSSWAYICIALFGILICSFLFIYFFIKRYSWSNKFLDFNLMKTNWYSGNAMKYLILIVALMSMVVIMVYLQSFYSLAFVYSMIPFYIMFFIIIPFIIMNYINDYKQQKNINFILLINIMFTSLIFIFLWIFGIEQSSVWRIMFILPTMGLGESLVGYCCLMALNLHILFPFIKSLNWKWSIKFIELKTHKATTIALSTTVLIAGCVPSAIVAINPAMTNYLWNTYSTNVEKNLNLFSATDINKMLSLSKITVGSSWNFVFDNVSSSYIAISIKQNYSYHFYEKIFQSHGISNVGSDGRNTPISALGFYKSKFIFSERKNKYIVNQSLNEFGTWLNEYLQSNIWNTYVDILFLSKNTEYYKFIEFNPANLTYDSNIFEDITIITKNQDILNTIRANV